MFKFFILVILLFSSSFAKDLTPTFVYKASGSVTDIVYSNSKVYVATDASCIDVFDVVSQTLIESIKIPQIKDFMGDLIDSKVYNVDIYKGKILLTSQGNKGFREIYIYSDNKIENIISVKDKMFVSKAKFIDENIIVFSLLGNDMYLYDLRTKTIIWKIDVRDPIADFNSTFADFALNEDRTIAVVSDESGDLKLVDIQKGKVIKVLANRNLDKVFKVDFKNNKIITAGQDGRCVVYNLNTKSDYFLREKRWFLIYGVALSPSAKLGAFSSDENNNVTVFNTNNKRKLFKLKDNLMTLSSIIFINENEIFITTDSNKFNYYNLTQ
jgi:outer membrane protein assembly factor BamB